MLFLSGMITDLKYILETNTNILDVKEQVGKLDCVYDGISLSRSKRNIRLIILKIYNQGSNPILKSYYDKRAPLGFVIEDGIFAEPPQIISALTTTEKK